MRVSVSPEKQDLKKEHASGPHARTAPEPGKDVFAYERLELEQKERAKEDGESGRHVFSVQFSVFSMGPNKSLKTEHWILKTEAKAYCNFNGS